jgi:UDP-GlcNAc3NAcA epimerase
MKIVTILGARPQFIKAAALSRVIRSDQSIKEIIVHTGQHYDADMSDIFFEQMDIPKPHYKLNIKSQHHGQMTGRMLEGIEEILLLEKPDCVVVYGDTNSTLAGALAAKKLHIKLIHIEAGLRSNNMKMPEEINRIVTDRLSDILFCPSAKAVKTLEGEGFQNYPCTIYDVGDIMKDVAVYYRDVAVKPDFYVPEKFILATIHRAENTDDTTKFMNIMEALNTLSQRISIILPMHPRTKHLLDKISFRPQANLLLHSPVGYLEMLYLLKHCQMVITDSGGLQKEAFYFNKYCVTTRNETEWSELVESGYNLLSGSDPSLIVKNADMLFESPPFESGSLYGDGNTSQKIIDIVKGCETTLEM